MSGLTGSSFPMNAVLVFVTRLTFHGNFPTIKVWKLSRYSLPPRPLTRTGGGRLLRAVAADTGERCGGDQRSCADLPWSVLPRPRRRHPAQMSPQPQWAPLSGVACCTKTQVLGEKTVDRNICQLMSVVVMQRGCECCLEWARANIVTKQTVSQKAAARMVQGAGGHKNVVHWPPDHCCRHLVLWHGSEFCSTTWCMFLSPILCVCGTKTSD